MRNTYILQNWCLTGNVSAYLSPSQWLCARNISYQDWLHIQPWNAMFRRRKSSHFWQSPRILYCLIDPVQPFHSAHFNEKKTGSDGLITDKRCLKHRDRIPEHKTLTWWHLALLYFLELKNGGPYSRITLQPYKTWLLRDWLQTS